MSTSNRPPFPRVIDSTLVASFRSCPRKFFLEYLEHWKPKSTNVHLHAGASYARGLEYARKAFFEQGLDPQTSIALGLKALIESYGDFQCPPESAKSLERTAGALEYYFSQFPLETERAVPLVLPSGKRAIEFSFAEPIDIRHPETGDPLIYCGRMDQCVEYAGGSFGEDDKTTSSLGASWAKQWDLRSQFTSYCWGAGRAGRPLNGFLVRGVSILKTKYDHLEVLTYRPEWMIERWYDQLLKDTRRMIQSWESGEWDYNLDHACTEFGGCIFRQVCLSRDPQPWLETGFEHRMWNPLTREEATHEPI